MKNELTTKDTKSTKNFKRREEKKKRKRFWLIFQPFLFFFFPRDLTPSGALKSVVSFVVNYLK